MNRKVLVYLVFGGAVTASVISLIASVQKDTEEFETDGVLWISNTENAAEKPGEIHISENYAENSPETESCEYVAVSETEFLMVDINRAGKDELCRLDGIGEKTAYAVIGYRNETGGFSDITEIMNVDGIGEKTFASIREHIYVTEEFVRAAETETVCTDAPEEVAAQEQMIYVPEETEDITEETQTEATIGIININTASAGDFMKLPGIDSRLAGNIIDLRTSIKYFQHIYELLYAEGMTEEKLAEIDEYLTV
ncbi:MAG: ComEA family DNA-binding protein [Porcipelethomonas sp.]